MGGATVARFALDHPELLKALVLLNPAPLIGRPLATDWEAQIRQQFASGRTSDDMAMHTPGVPEALRQALQADVLRNPIERALGGRRSMASLNLRPRLHELSMPVFVVGGDKDNRVGVYNILAEYLALPAERRFLHIFHGIGHSPNVEVAVDFASLLDHFVSRTVASSLATEARTA
jgi:pimeloyl-ACP methyl ester carboxylesterase